MPEPSLVIAGAGPVGTGLARLLVSQGHRVTLASRNPASAEAAATWAGCRSAPLPEAAREAGWLFLTPGDDQIPALLDQLRPHVGPAIAVVAHLSGARPASILEGPWQVLSMHPVASLPTREAAWERLQSCWFGVEGDSQAMAQAGAWITAWGGRVFRIGPDSKALYHAGACVASNYACTLMAAASALWEAAGVPPEAARDALLSLTRGTLESIGRDGPAAALTGPIQRGDSSTVRRHLQALREQEPQWLELYRVLGLYTLRLAPNTELEALLNG